MKSGLIYIDDFEPEMFAPLVGAARLEGIPFEVHSEPNGLQAAMEWWVMPAVAIYIAKPFVDKFLAKAAEDAIAAAYPKFKDALSSLVRRLYRTERSGVVKQFVTTQLSGLHQFSHC